MQSGRAQSGPTQSGLCTIGSVSDRVRVRSGPYPIGKSCRVRLLMCAIGPHSHTCACVVCPSMLSSCGWHPVGHGSIEHEPLTALETTKLLSTGRCDWWCLIEP
ncbi:hypothetical protein ALC57_02413 [Trachymyrmex cornetzi]|uniref:Uncharacterized protein n=1 Tax=Trachymyrmex cornetzi TaxID=471704 RepID=A0A151JNN3_9HYME|nr:hypothetical protein ALC57_02413 [Trachymyrmex cornetzi]